MPDNYNKMELQARQLFLKLDQQSVISDWGLRSDANYIYADFFGKELRIDRKTAVISSEEPDPVLESTCNESMILFDILSRRSPLPEATGRWASISMLGGHIGAGHDRTLRNEPQAAVFAGQTERLAAACESIGGTPFSKADVGYAIPVFRDFRILFQFWDADDEFPASIKYLFDENALQYMNYETLWYVMGAAYKRIRHAFGHPGA